MASKIASNIAFVAALRERLGDDASKYLKQDKRGNWLPKLSKKDGTTLKDALADKRISDLVQARVVVKSIPLGVARIDSMLQTALPNGKLPIPLNFSLAGTGRWSGGSDNSFNFQNLQKEYKPLIVAPPGHTIIQADLSQIELRVSAYLAGEFQILDAFNSGDVYSALGTRMFGRQVVKGTPDRQLAKKCCLGCSYGTGAKKFAAISGLSLAEAERAVAMYRSTFPNIVASWRAAEMMYRSALAGGKRILPALKCTAVREGQGIALTTPGGYMLRYPRMDVTADGRLRTYDMERPVDIHGGFALENITQHVARNVLAEIILRLEDAGFKVAAHCHDSILVVCSKKICLFAKDRVQSLMTVVPKWLDGCPLGAEVKVSNAYQ